MFDPKSSYREADVMKKVAIIGGHTLKYLTIRNFFIDLFVADEATTVPLLEKSHRVVDRDAVDPGKKRGLTFESSNRLEGLDKSLLSEV